MVLAIVLYLRQRDFDERRKEEAKTYEMHPASIDKPKAKNALNTLSSSVQQYDGYTGQGKSSEYENYY